VREKIAFIRREVSKKATREEEKRAIPVVKSTFRDAPVRRNSRIDYFTTGLFLACFGTTWS